MNENVILHRGDLLEVLRCADRELRELGAVGGPFSTLEKVCGAIAEIEAAPDAEATVPVETQRWFGHRAAAAIFRQLDLRALMHLASGAWQPGTVLGMLAQFRDVARVAFPRMPELQALQVETHLISGGKRRVGEHADHGVDSGASVRSALQRLVDASLAGDPEGSRDALENAILVLAGQTELAMDSMDGKDGAR